jgi:hypothetical protein
MAISWRWQSETYPRTWAIFLKQCHSPLDLRQYNLSVSPSCVSSIGTRVYTSHHETLDTSRSRISRCAAATAARVTGMVCVISRHEGPRNRIDSRQHAPVRFEVQSGVLGSPAMESA